MPRSVPGHMVGSTAPPPGGDSHVSVGHCWPAGAGLGKEMGSLPEGLFSPNSVAAMELPLSWPPSSSNRIAGAAACQGMLHAPGQRATTTVLAFAAVRLNTISSIQPGKASVLRSLPSLESVATTITTRSAPFAAAAAAAGSCVL